MNIRGIKLNNPTSRAWKKHPESARLRPDLAKRAQTATLPALSSLEKVLPSDPRAAEDIVSQNYGYLEKIGFGFEKLGRQSVFRLSGEALSLEGGEIFSDGVSAVFALHQFYQKWTGLLQVKYQHLWEMWNHAPVGYQTLRTDGTIITANQTLADMLGYEVDEMRGRSIFDFILPKQREAAHQRFLDKLEGKEVSPSMERTYLRHDGTRIYLSATDNFIRDPAGNIRAVRTALIDVTKLRRAQDQLYARKKSQPLAEGLADELNNLLGGISGAAQLLDRRLKMPADGQDPEKIFKYLNTIREGCDSISATVNSILDWSGIRQPFSGEIRARDIEEFVRQQISVPPGVELNIANQASDSIEGDRQQIFRTVNNLISHGVYALEQKGSVSVQIKDLSLSAGRTTALGHALKPGGYLSVSVSYSARDITDDNISQVFDPYFPSRVNKNNTQEIKFGLSTILGVVVDAYGGAIEIENISGNGNKITLFFPSARTEIEML